MSTHKKQKKESQKEVKEKKDEVELVCDIEECREHKSFWDVIRLPWYECIILGILVTATITMFILHNKFASNFGILIGVVITAALLGLWLAFRPSEWAVDGLDNIMRYVGLSAYVAGVISSLASNLPEAVAAGIMLIKGAFGPLKGTDLGGELIITAFYTTLAAAGFNAILLGIVVLVGGKKKGYIEVKRETMAAEGVLMRWGFVAMLLTFGVAVIEILDKLFTEIKDGGNFPGIDELEGELPRMASIALVVSYIIYVIFLIIESRKAKREEEANEVIKQEKPTRSKLDEKMPEKTIIESTTEPTDKTVWDTLTDKKDSQNEKNDGGFFQFFKPKKESTNPFIKAPHMEHPHFSVSTAVVLVILGIAGIATGGYLLSHAVEIMLEAPQINMEIEIVALIVGFSGAVPEHGIAVVAATKGKTEVALGNIVGGMLQMTLLIFGLFGSIAPAPINDFMLFQIIAIAGIVWFVKRSIVDDNRITAYEGIMVIIAQLFSFFVLLGELTGLKGFI